MASPASWAKTHSTSVCLIPPRSLWPRIQEARVFADKSFTRWPPHINLLYPFVEAAHLPEAAQLCRDALRSVQSFQVTLDELRWFEHGRSCTLWARPEAPELLAVQAALVDAFPQCSDLSDDPARGIAAFTPHLSLGQWRTRSDVVAAAAAHRAGAWRQPTAFRAGGVALISRAGFEEPFAVRFFVPFGGGEPLELNVPYLATVGEPCHLAAPAVPAAGAADASATPGNNDSGSGITLPQLPYAGEFGLGAARADGSVWQFAYGANICPRKLSGVRGVTPLESLPATLPGWRLGFTHRGGMGNLQQLAPGDAGPAGLHAVHGVAHRLSPADYGRLINMEHEYRPVEVAVQPYAPGSAPLPAVVLVTPEDKLIAGDLPPPQRYLELLQEGAQHWQLDPRYVSWLNSLRGIESRDRGEAYYTAAGSGEALPALPKVRTGSQPRQQGRGRRGSGRQGGRGSGDGGRGGGQRSGEAQQ